MRRLIVILSLGTFAFPLTADGQFYGIRRDPSPRSSSKHSESPGYQGAYDRAAEAWRNARQDCITGKRGKRSTRDACGYTNRTAPPLSSDYLKAPPAQ